MAFAFDLRRPLRALVAPAVFLTITGYFVWNVTQGNRGLVSHAERLDLLRQVQVANVTAKNDRDKWEQRVAGLRARNLNPDTLDERARAMLNLAEPTDVIVNYAPREKLF